MTVTQIVLLVMGVLLVAFGASRALAGDLVIGAVVAVLGVVLLVVAF